ncbi:Uncharacterised protein [uncultured archaeon]|nr:Uncharacterised protein [uncultured archaeon]
MYILYAGGSRLVCSEVHRPRSMYFFYHYSGPNQKEFLRDMAGMYYPRSENLTARHFVH